MGPDRAPFGRRKSLSLRRSEENEGAEWTGAEYSTGLFPLFPNYGWLHTYTGNCMSILVAIDHETAIELLFDSKIAENFDFDHLSGRNWWSGRPVQMNFET